MKKYIKHLENLYSQRTFQRKVEYIKYNIAPSIDIKNKNQEVLEVGPGLGELVYFLNSNNIKNIDIVDNDKSIIANIEKKFKIRNSYFSNSILKLKNKLHKYDLIILIQVLEHLPPDDYIQTIKAFYDLLNPKGLLVIVAPNANNPLGLVERYGDLQHTSSFTTQSFIDLTLSAGIPQNKLEISGFEIPPYSLINVLRIFAQKTLHLWLYLLLAINGGVFYKPLTPNLMLKIYK